MQMPALQPASRVLHDADIEGLKYLQDLDDDNDVGWRPSRQQARKFKRCRGLGAY